MGGGGNKVRLFEYIAADILKSRAKKIITFGSIHSNHIRVSAIVAGYLGIGCDLILLHDEDKFDASFSTPNLKMIRHCKSVNVVHCKTQEAHEFIDDYLSKQKDYYWIPGGGHTTTAIFGYADIARRLLKEDVKYDAIFLPCGTGTSQAGLIYGMNKEIPVYGVTVARTIEKCYKAISELLLANNFSTEDIEVLPCSIPYGNRSIDIERIIGQLLRSDGIYLDPIYNAKAFFEMTNFLEDQKMKNVLYINTGGQPNIFA